MNDNKLELQDLQDALAKLRLEVGDLTSQFFKNNFSARQDFPKASSFSTSLKVPSYTTRPVGEVGEIIEVGGVLEICSAYDSVTKISTWSVVGSQS